MNTKTTLSTGLSQVLAESYTVYLQTQQSHWNVVGADFFQLHQAFEAQYTELADAIDEIAEQIRQIGAMAPGSFAEFAKLSQLKHEVGSDARAIVSILVAMNEQLLKTIKTVRAQAQELGDEATADLLINRERVHQKTVWFLRAYLG
jgi:starvation-inducible DNA-binding protein